MIRTVIIDDEEKSMKALSALLARYCPDVEVVAHADSVLTAVKVLNEHKPDLVFADVLMPDGTGFDVLERCHNRKFGVIFVTAFEEHALRAFRFSALHYLLKPVNFLELQEAIERFKELKKESKDQIENSHFEVAKNSFNSASPQNIVLPTIEGFSVVKISDIIRCEADSNYTKIFFTQGKPFLASRTLTYFEEAMSGLHFVRIHHKHLVNLTHVKRYLKGRGGYVEMADGNEVEVSTRKKEEFLNAMARFARGTD
jgi:two-component system LytT family response regulator